MNEGQGGEGQGGEGQGGAGGEGQGGAGGEGQGGAGGEGQGGAAGMMAGGEGQGGEGQGGEGEGGAGGEGQGGDDWYAGLSDEAPGEGKLSDKAWLENKKYADLPAVIKAARESEVRLIGGDKIVVPKDGDAPEVFDNFYKTLGRPEKAEDYAIDLGEGVELDEGFSGFMKEAAHKSGMPQDMFTGMVGPFNEYMEKVAQEQVDQRTASKVQGLEDYKAEIKTNGQDLNASIAAANTAMRGLELDKDAVAAIEDGLETRFPGEGTKRTMQLFEKLGKGMSEDILTGGGGTPKFAMSAANAQAELDKYSSDEGLRAKILGKDPTHKARYDMLVQVVAAAEAKAAEG